MKKETTQQLREQTLEQLYKSVDGSQSELREVRFKLANRELKDTTVKASLKRHIARMLTIIREKEEEAVTKLLKT